MIYEEICKLRAYAEGIQSEGIAGRRELDELIERIYQLQNRLYMLATK
jgi:hypothetical protein